MRLSEIGPGDLQRRRKKNPTFCVIARLGLCLNQEISLAVSDQNHDALFSWFRCLSEKECRIIRHFAASVAHTYSDRFIILPVRAPDGNRVPILVKQNLPVIYLPNRSYFSPHRALLAMAR
jgi:hypothetical protein